jgi:hypothetical protein
MLRGRRAAIAYAVAFVTVTALTAGCGGGSSSSSALSLDPVSAAATKTQNAGAARIRFSMTISGQQMQGRTLRMRGTGVIDGSSAEMNFKLASMLGQLGLPSAARKTLAHSSLKAIELDQNGDFVMYVHLGFLSSQIPGGKQWIELDLSKLGKSVGVDFSKLMSGSQLQPSDMLSMLKGRGTTIHKLGPATVDGSATTRYRVTIDVAKMLQSEGLTSPLMKSFAAKTKTMTEDVWIGKTGLVRRIQASYGVAAAGQSVGVGMTMDIYDYGAHVTIAAPPSSEVFDATQLVQQGSGGSLP